VVTGIEIFLIHDCSEKGRRNGLTHRKCQYTSLNPEGLRRMYEYIHDVPVEKGGAAKNKWHHDLLNPPRNSPVLV